MRLSIDDKISQTEAEVLEDEPGKGHLQRDLRDMIGDEITVVIRTKDDSREEIGRASCRERVLMPV